MSLGLNELNWSVTNRTYQLVFTKHLIRPFLLYACSAPNHYLKQCWLIVNWDLRKKCQWNSNQNTKRSIHENENAYKSVVCQIGGHFVGGGGLTCWATLGRGLLKLRSLISRYGIISTMFTFARWLRSSAAVTPAKYELDIIQVTTVFIIRKKWEKTERRKLA